MIPLDEIISQLHRMEASQIHVADPITKRITLNNANDIVAAVNTAISDIGLNFITRNASLRLLLTPDRVKYELNPDNASTSDKGGKYILDSVDEPFLDTVLEVHSVTDLNGGSYPLNVSVAAVRDRQLGSVKQGISFITPTWGQLRCTPVSEETQVIVDYKAAPPRLELLKGIGDVGDEEYDAGEASFISVDLPYIFLMPIVYFCVMRLNSPRGTQRAGQQTYSESNSYYAKYKSECEQIMRTLNNNAVTTEQYNSFDYAGFP